MNTFLASESPPLRRTSWKRDVIGALLALAVMVSLANPAAAAPPVVAAAMADTTVAEDALPVENYRDLTTVFSDPEDGGALTFTIQSNSNPGLLNVAIDADSALDWSVAADSSGAATVVIRATDSEALFVEDTLIVTVTPVNDPPVVALAIPDTLVSTDAAPIDNYRDLNNVFFDVEEGGVLSFTIESNSNPGLVNVTIDADSALDLSFAAGNTGIGTIVIRGTDSDMEFAEATFDVEVRQTLWIVRADGSGDAPTIQAAINNAIDGDTVLVTDGVYRGVGNVNVRFNGRAILVTSQNGPATTVIDCDSLDRAFDFLNGETNAAVVNGFTIRNGIKQNGGAIHMQAASPTISNNVIIDCGAVLGGGVFCEGGSAPRLVGNVFINNNADLGGGVYSNVSSPVIENCTFVANSAVTEGAGVYFRNAGSPTLVNSIVAFSTSGAGVACGLGATPTIACSNIFGNAGGDALCGVDGGGNISADPLFCGPVVNGEVTISSFSPCAPANNSCAVLIGAGQVTCGEAPIVIIALPDTTVTEDSPPIDDYRNLTAVFYDIVDGNVLDFAVETNSNPSLVTATIDADSALDISFAPNGHGTATLIIRATDSSLLSARDTLDVTVSPVNDPPVVVAAIPDTTVTSGVTSIDNYRDLRSVFYDVEDGPSLDFSIVNNSNPGLVLATIDADSSLDLALAAGSGSATIVVRATDAGALFVEDTLTVAQTVNTVVLNAVPLSSRTVLPGGTTGPMFSMSINNQTAVVETVTALTFTNATNGPGSVAELDASFTPLRLTVRDNRPVATNGAVFATSTFSGGHLAYPDLAVVVNPGETVVLDIEGGASLLARDPDVLDFVLADSSDITVRPSAVKQGIWPLTPAGAFSVDGMASAQLDVQPVGAFAFPSGTTRNLALNVVVPPNGYEPDRLNRINVTNLGTAAPEQDIALMEAWIDDGDGTFNESGDTYLGMFSFTGSRWELTGLGVDVAAGGTRLFVTVDIGDFAAEGRTVQLALPHVPDVAIGMDSSNDGPVDRTVANPFTQSITSVETVVLSSVTMPDMVYTPGSRNVSVLQLIATNNYPGTRMLTRLTVRNTSVSPGNATQDDLDGEFSRVVLRIDGNDNGQLDDIATDPVAGISFFSTGRAVFNSVPWTLPPGAARHMFVVVDISGETARDGDELAVAVSDVFDVEFSDVTAITAGWPLAGPRVRVDGMLATQIQSFSIRPTTLAPNDGPIAALDLIVPGNGYASDVLRALEVINLGTATDADLGDLRMWRDGGDGVFTPGANGDSEVAPMVWTGGAWRTPLVAEPLPVGGARFFVGATVAAAPNDVSLQLAVPVGGITVESGNDGPIDVAVASEQALWISTEPLLATLDVVSSASTTGQRVDVTMEVRNVGTEVIAAITPSVLVPSGDASLSLISGPAPATIDLPPSGTGSFTWTYQSTVSGSVVWQGYSQGTGASSGLLRTTPNAVSNAHRVFDLAGDLELFALESMPFRINRGQRDVVPLSLTFAASGDSKASDTRVRSLRLRLQDGQDQGIVPADLIERVVVSEGNVAYLTRTNLETTGDIVDLTLATPLIIKAGEQATLSIRFDMLPTTTVPDVRCVVDTSSWFIAEDAVSGAPLVVNLPGSSFPIVSGLGRIVAAPTELDVAPAPMSSQRVGVGQSDVVLLRTQLENPGIDGLTTDVVVAALEFTLTDTAGVVSIPAVQYLERVRVQTAGGLLAERIIDAADADTIRVAFSTLGRVAVNNAIDLEIVGDISTQAPVGVFRMRLGDPSRIGARDANTGAPVPVVYQASPVQGGALSVEAVADTVRVAGTPLFPSTLAVGAAAVDATELAIRHTGTTGTGRVRVDAVVVRCQNEQRAGLVPSDFLAALHAYQGTTAVGSTTRIPTSGSQVTVPLSGVYLEPAETVRLRIRIDVTATAPQSFLELVAGGTDIIAVDANRSTPVTAQAEAGAVLPVTSGLARIVAPATELRATLEDRMPAALAAGVAPLNVANLSLTNTAPSGSGTITVDHLVLRGADAGWRPVAVGTVAERARVYVGGTLAGESAALTIDSTTAWIGLATPIVLSPTETVQATIDIDVRTDVAAKTFRLGIDESGVGVVQPASALFQIDVVPPAGEVFPLWTETGSLSGRSLRESFSNFPNPFAAGREPTTFVYYLATAADVTLRLWTPRGEEVITLRNGERRPAGLYQDDVWNGRNGRGVAVLNGVYIAELEARFADGKTERLLRKVAVLR